jgi:acetyl-CoA C-acetyltransferase
MIPTSYICSPKRTAIGSFQGSLSQHTATQLGTATLQASLTDSKLDPGAVDSVYMGCVLTAGLGQAPARQAALGASLPNSVPCTTVGKVCGSGLKSVMIADLLVRTGENQVVLAGGMESMSQSPYLVPKLRSGLRLGHGSILDSMIKDGLWDVYNDFHMGQAAELCAKKFQLSREAQDTYATESYRRALHAQKEGLFGPEIVPILVKTKHGQQNFSIDEEATHSDPSRFAGLKPAFDPQGTVTAANASSLNDGAASLIVASESAVKKHGLKPMARIVAQSEAAHEAAWFTTAPALSIERLLKKSGLTTKDIDLWEINEAFSAVALANLELLKLNPAQVNTRGGAVALGHPIGASGARILVTLLHALNQMKLKRGVASLCLGGGEAVSVLVENLS